MVAGSQTVWCLAAALLLATAAAPAAAQPVDYALDPTHSSVTFEVLHFDTATIRGRFSLLNGTVQWDRSAGRGRVQVVIDTASVSTGVPVLDALLRRDDLLASGPHPQAFFVAEQFSSGADGAVQAVAGEFTLRGSSRGLRLQAQRFRCYTHPLLRREVCGGDFEATLPRSAFGITHSLPFVADTVRLLVQVEAIRQTP
ncbi:YceI family protein [Pseudaquabacterium pictum]|uniref:YceI family protein n=1 Tax=Pseudaquabacterium pictum TaxID=2315236 RepID=UPI0010F4A642|nr:YceI family protein [Rubrivivax pictus]